MKDFLSSTPTRLATLRLTLVLAITANFCGSFANGLQAQIVAFCGIDAQAGTSSTTAGDEFSFVALVPIPDTEVIFFTEDDYSETTEDFTDGSAPNEGFIRYTPPTGGLAVGEVVRITEGGGANANTYTVAGAGGTAVDVGGFTFSLVIQDEIYAFSASDPTMPWSTVTEIHAFIWTAVIPATGGGLNASSQSPAAAYPNAVLQLLNVGGGGGVVADYTDANRVNATIADLTDPSNWTISAANPTSGINLSTTNFINSFPMAASSPVAVCQDIMVNADANCEGTAVAADFDGGSSDADGDMLSFSVSPMGPYSLGGPTMVTLTVTAGGETDDCTAMITVTDNTPPTASNPAPIEVDCFADVPAPDPEVVTDEADNCGMSTCTSSEIWINEFHYDNTEGDVGEFIEVAGPAGTDLSGYSLILYNGSNGTSYNTISLMGTIDDESNGFGAVSFSVAGIQNGAPDGIALVNGTNVIEFLSYEGSFTAANGAAAGVTSVNVGVAETSSTPIGVSLQLTGTGNMSSDFSWSGPVTDSPGDLNDGQSLPACSVTGVTVTYDTEEGNGGAGSASSPLIISRDYTVTDAAGNSITVTQTITITDSEAPTANCPADITVSNDMGACSAVVNYSIPAPTDNCPGATSMADMPAGSTFLAGTTAVTVTATDAAGLTDDCSFNVTVNDTEAPTISNCPTTLSDGVVGINSCLNATPNYTVFVTLDDNCSDPADITIEQFPPTGTQLGVGMFEIKLVAMDEAGLFSDTCRFTLNNVDRTPPEITACVSPTT
ncbi:MAG: HYR domain-containing protein, partial [Bacteroidota bacterium]